MTRTINILIVDDHPLMIEGYKFILQSHAGYTYNVHCASSCETAYTLLDRTKENFQIAIFDWILPTFGKLNNGGDLALFAQKKMPTLKSIIITSHEEAFELYNITKKVNPSGLLVKSDFHAEDLLHAINEICEGRVYQSSTVIRSIKQINSRDKYLDNYSRQIISLLARGIKTKSIPTYLPLSISAVDKRKAQIRDYFLINGGNDEDILREAKKAGFI